jgi:hypothetical protein
VRSSLQRDGTVDRRSKIVYGCPQTRHFMRVEIRPWLSDALRHCGIGTDRACLHPGGIGCRREDHVLIRGNPVE